MSDNRRSQIVTAGTHRAPNRSMLRAVGFGDEDFNKPIVGIANGYSTITPCNLSLNILAKRAETALRQSRVYAADVRRHHHCGRDFDGNRRHEIFSCFP